MALTVRDAVIAHARAEAPAECCGVLLGTQSAIVDAMPGHNAADEPTRRYVLDPQDHFNAIRAARQRGLAVAGFYHSHPHSDPAPSEADRAQANYPGHLYLIVSLATEPPATRLFALVDGALAAVPFSIG